MENVYIGSAREDYMFGCKIGHVAARRTVACFACPYDFKEYFI